MIVIFSNPEGLSIAVKVQAYKDTEDTLMFSDETDELVIKKEDLKKIFTDIDMYDYNEGITLAQFKDLYIQQIW